MKVVEALSGGRRAGTIRMTGGTVEDVAGQHKARVGLILTLIKTRAVTCPEGGGGRGGEGQLNSTNKDA